MATTKRTYKEKTFIGKKDGYNIYLTSPSWDCGWYWGFGYLGNNRCHYHVDGLKHIENYIKGEDGHFHLTSEHVNLYEGFKRHFDEDTFIVKEDNDIWKLAELFETFYRLRETAEVFGRGGSHYTENPCKNILIDKELVNRINEVILPEIFEEIYKILEKYSTK